MDVVRDRIAALVSREFFWALLFFLCVFGLGAWLFTLDNAELVAAVVGVVVSALALIVSPTEMRGSILAALASALVLVLIAVLAVHAYGRFRPLDITEDVLLRPRGGEAQPRVFLRGNEEADISVPIPQGWARFSITFRVSDDPELGKLYGCADEPETGLELVSDTTGAAVELEPGDEHVVELRGASSFDSTVTMRTSNFCALWLSVQQAELHR
ncbi:hypothetical protein [Saccharopolyspora sp. CA-218241]|uniref:hypothetical protein n=1 Tax=Saccharopolyspora sp. CA-218241 TaxID=3240027 RepID=UPI003D959A09